MFTAFLLCNAFATFYLVGLIWLVQCVHYPLFRLVGEGGFAEYQKRHQLWITFVVGPPMLIEALTSVLVLFFLSSYELLWLHSVGIGLVFVIWLSTGFVQVPCHAKLEKGFDPIAHRRLVRTNWIRTIAWTLRGILMIYLIVASFDLIENFG